MSEKFYTRMYTALRVEGEVGASPEQIGRDLITMAGALEFPVICTVNGADMVVSPGASLDDVRQQYERQLAALNSSLQKAKAKDE